MKFRHYFAFFLAFLTVFALPLPISATEEISDEDAPIEQVPLTPYIFSTDLTVRAKAAMLIELNSNTLIYEYQKDLKLFPASLTKIMTCILAIEHGDLDAVLTVSETALQNLSEFGSTAGLKQGEQLTLNDLLYCIMISSANEGCNVIAEHISGDISSFVALMNKQAKRLGMNSTHFANAHGLHNENHYTTAYDLSLLARWAWQNDTFRQYATATSYVVPATNLSGERTLYTTNYLTSTDVDSKYYYSYASGIKTGFTTPAGGCLISTASNNGMDLLSIVMGCSPQTADNGEFGDERFVETKKLFRYGLENISFVQVLSEAKMADMPNVLYADGRDTIVVRSAENRTVLLPAGCTAADIQTSVSYTTAPLQAPLDEGQEVGIVTAYYNGQPVASAPAVCVTAVDRLKEEHPTQPQLTQTVPEVADDTKSWFSEYWYLSLPILIVALLLILLIILRTINIRKAKKRAAARRRNAERRRPRG